jgi:hypothetical protein
MPEMVCPSGGVLRRMLPGMGGYMRMDSLMTAWRYGERAVLLMFRTSLDPMQDFSSARSFSLISRCSARK